MPTFPPDFDQKWLWEDPEAPDPAAHYGAVLLAEEIRHYVEQYNLFIDKDTFEEGNLKGASYTMSPHAEEGWIIRDRGVVKNTASRIVVAVGGTHERLARKRNSRGPYYIVPANSLAYIRLKEKLRIPFYAIGRHNLKIDYVYQGLLLGTGPQVDPGFIGQIYIPLHNLTNREVEIYINETFVSIDFVRTSPLPLKKGVPNTYQEFYEVYNSDKRLILPEKIEKKRNLEAYLQGARPSSSLGDLVPQVRKLASDVARRRLIELALFFTLLAFLVTLLGTYFLHFDRQLTSKTDDASNRINSLQKEFEYFRDDLRSVPFQVNVHDAERQLQKLREQVDGLERELAKLKPAAATPSMTATPPSH